jgi:hypothetical protein
MFGLAAIGASVFGFARAQTGDAGTAPAEVWSISTTGVGTQLPDSVSFTNGWSGAGVTSNVSITLSPPPPPPPK